MSTIKEIAQRAGVSIGTVDRVIHNRGRVNEKTRTLVRAVMEELNYQPNLAAQGLAIRKKKLKLCMFVPDIEGHPYFADVREAALRKAEELEQYGVQVLFLTLQYSLTGIGQASVFRHNSEYLKVLEQVDGVSIVGIDDPFINRILDRAEELKLPVVFYTTLLSDRAHIAYVGCDYVKSGKLAAGLVCLTSGDCAKICVYSEDIKVTSHEDRLKGFRQELEANFSGSEILDVRVLCNDFAKDCVSAREMLDTWPDVDAVYVINPGDYRICEAIRQADTSRRIRIITNDLVEGQRQMVANGIITATVCQEPEQQGSLPLEILFKYLAYNILPEQKMNLTRLSIHIAQSLY